MKKVCTGLLALLFAVFVVTTPLLASAHVGYVLDRDQFLSNQGADTSFLFSGFHEAPLSAAVAALIGVVVVGLILYVRSRSSMKIFLAACKSKIEKYHEFLGWIARLSVGIALIGSGTAHALISPVLTGIAGMDLIQILLGFMFLLGFLLTPAYLATIVVFFIGLSHSGYLVGNVDFLALVISAFLLANSRPGLDDILGIKSHATSEKAKELVPIVLRLGLGFAFIFLAVYEKFLNPHDSQLVVQLYHLTNVIPVPASLWVLGAGTVEFVLGVLLIIGLEVRLVSIVAFLVISLSFFYFKESVYSHVTLFGAISMLIVTGAGKWSVDHRLSKNSLE